MQCRVVAPGFFGFDQYLGQSDSLPASEHVDRLTAQLTIIEKLCEELYAAGIMELRSVSREVFDVVKRGRGTEPSSRRRSRRRDDKGGSAEHPGPLHAGRRIGPAALRSIVARPVAPIER